MSLLKARGEINRFPESEVMAALGLIEGFAQLEQPKNCAKRREDLRVRLRDTLRNKVNPILIELIMSDLPEILQIKKDRVVSNNKKKFSFVIRIGEKNAPQWRQEFIRRFLE